MSGWEDGSSSREGALRREVFFFRSGSDLLYGSLTVTDPATSALGLVVCPSWGQDMADQLELCHHVARAVAASGGAGLVYHPPGHGDSRGDIATLSLERLVASAVDASAAAAARVPDIAWQVAGVGLGATVAALAAQRLDGSILPLVQPDLDPGSYFGRLERYARLARLGTEGVLFGYPLSEELRSDAAEVDLAPALRPGPRRVARIRFAAPVPPPAPVSVEDVVVPGEWLQPLYRSDLPGLAAATVRWARAALDDHPDRVAAAERRA